MSGVGSTPPGTAWIAANAPRKRRRRQNPEDMFTPEQNYERNKEWAEPGPYWTKLDPAQEQLFRQWIAQNSVDFDPDQAQPDYDMRGFWQALQQGDPEAKSAIDANDKKRHWPDYWKTPYDATFSAQSQWAIQGKAPEWEGDRLTLPGGHVLYDDQTGEWFGTGQEPGG